MRATRGSRPGWPRLPTGQALDVALAVVVGLVAVASELSSAVTNDVPPDPYSFALLLCGAAAIALLRPYPLPAALIIGLSTPLYYLLGEMDTAAPWIALMVGMFRLAASGRRAAAITGTAVTVGLFAVGETLAGGTQWMLLALGWPLAVLAAGEIARNRREYLREVEGRAEAAERVLEEEGRRRASEERLRIARELHDVLAHQISLINVQASAAAHRRDPEQAYAALEAIKVASRDTLRELRATLGMLRQVDGEKSGERGGDTAPVTPAPSIRRLDELAAQTTEAGLPVALTVEGEERETPLPAPVDLAAYRIVQEALTNSLRHAGAATASVLLRHQHGTLAVQIDDDGQGAPGAVASEGNGIRGMRERALAVGGEFTAGPRPEGGFRVRATLPLPDTAR